LIEWSSDDSRSRRHPHRAGNERAVRRRDSHGTGQHLSQSPGFRGYKVNKSIESPERYLLMIYWDTLENHTVDFRQGPLFAQWRAIVGAYFAPPRWSSISSCSRNRLDGPVRARRLPRLALSLRYNGCSVMPKDSSQRDAPVDVSPERELTPWSRTVGAIRQRFKAAVAQQRLKEAVMAVGDRAGEVQEFLSDARGGDDEGRARSPKGRDEL
jgi:heme-degrading monooxygenase HmoA